MTSVVLCPNCGGQKTVSKPPYIAGDVNAWVGSGTPTYPCPTCDGHGWIRVDSASQEDFVTVKAIALSSMETAENLMDECTKRADKIKELETRCNTLNKACERREISILKESDKLATKNILLGNMLLQNESEIERLRMKIFDIEGREDLVTTELEHQRDFAIKQRDNIARINTTNLRRLGDIRIEIDERGSREKELLEIIDDLTTENHGLESVIDTCTAAFRDLKDVYDRDTIGIEMLDEMLKIVNPLIKGGDAAEYAKPGRLLAIRMHGLCQTVIQFRRKHGIVG